SVGLTALLARRWGALSRVPVQVMAVRCPVHGKKTEVWAQAVTGELHSARLLRCSLLPGELNELSCSLTCLSQVEGKVGAGSGEGGST
ncbi:MAG: hypothetical protein GWM92_02195, partial [Gemmatimonadetes bacterium]|nr:hypothetical protein [Gemmatimonadota bacterium]NIR77287.1 hypothetical protein [Gemmatimonadota bacterium]NIT85805.1 hypothetical protein [Gemmatimonadota bacterium]NIU29631.1 hypothetical protein [Gemmatimonadota bacterium]NIU34678.1 hypothetical protein [Gemmatimonadota bacterium]